MYRRSTLNKPDADFIALANSILQQCMEHAEEWILDASRLSELNVLITKANTAYELNGNPAERNRSTAAVKQAAFKELKHFLSRFINYLEITLTVPDTAIQGMGLRPRKRHFHEPLPLPAQKPVITTTSIHKQITVRVARPVHDHATHGMRPPKYYGFKLRWRFEGEDEAFCRSELSTRLHYILHFDGKDEGRRIILAAAWINPRLESGPWSRDVTEIVC